MEISDWINDVPPIFSAHFLKVSGTFLAPSQRLLYYFGGTNTGKPENISFSYEYETDKKKYRDNIDLTLINGTSAMRQENDDVIKYALQDIAERLI